MFISAAAAAAWHFGFSFWAFSRSEAALKGKSHPKPMRKEIRDRTTKKFGYAINGCWALFCCSNRCAVTSVLGDIWSKVTDQATHSLSLYRKLDLLYRGSSKKSCDWNCRRHLYTFCAKTDFSDVTIVVIWCSIWFLIKMWAHWFGLLYGAFVVSWCSYFSSIFFYTLFPKWKWFRHLFLLFLEADVFRLFG